MKEKELREIANCAKCGKPFGHTQLPLFWRITIERFGVNMDAVRRQDGLTELFGGNPYLAQVMGPDQKLAQLITGPITVTLCENCALESVEIASLAESV